MPRYLSLMFPPLSAKNIPNNFALRRMENTEKSTPQKKRQNPNRCRPKSKGGCQRCKQRRRRCDEAKPSCQECTKRGHTCPGYQKQSLQWRYVFKGSEEPKQPAAQIESPETVATELFEVNNPTQDERDNLQNGTPSIWDTTCSNLFDQLPDFDEPTDAWSYTELRSNDTGLTNPDAELDGLSVLRQRLVNTSVPSFLIQLPVMLVQYYFHTVCNQWSSFDCPLNPFRTIVSRLWSRNAAIYFAIQSMSAASLANDFPNMRPIGIQTQQQAIACLNTSAQKSSVQAKDDEYFLALLMIGSTTGWHDASDLGLPYLRAAQDHLMRQERQCKNANSALAKQHPLFKQCLLWWNLLAAFVAEESPIVDVESSIENSDTDLSVYLVDGQILPHPWTGSFRYALSLFYRTARVIRAARTSHRRRPEALDPTLIDLSSMAEELDLRQKAEHLEDKILFTGFSFYCGPVDIGDTNTPPSHFLTLAEAYRCTALLQIYHVFPDILEDRLRSNQTTDGESPIPALFLLLFPIATEWSSCSVEDTRHTLALHIVSLLGQLPSTSGTKVLQPVVLACISSDLVFSSGSVLGATGNSITSLNTLDVEIAQARRKVKMRLSELILILPKLPMQRIVNVVHETWDRADSGVEEFWLDIMMDLNLETIMG
ncbi:Zn(2)-C6 fungal-type DNA-binding domain [Penicillium roqueforti FM164]|uniref:Zn(2)-C6 fungal-type DNA-binding domain n=1 Tax=Penicillium roqueforti (strain FM164) TaxID=1365484 RepID=W6QGM3_PENRF|nr:Zn(2)-C6 fungal-type DNA-binding domain [Penicillium roqueforti FM164]